MEVAFERGRRKEEEKVAHPRSPEKRKEDGYSAKRGEGVSDKKPMPVSRILKDRKQEMQGKGEEASGK